MKDIYTLQMLQETKFKTNQKQSLGHDHQYALGYLL